MAHRSQLWRVLALFCALALLLSTAVHGHSGLPAALAPLVALIIPVTSARQSFSTAVADIPARPFLSVVIERGPPVSR
jgi:hypothetical protein